MSENDQYWMQKALALAKKAEESDEVPVGAVIVKDEHVIGEGWNQPIVNHDPTAHAEIMAIRSAAQSSENYRIPGTTLYVTLEPCPMCAGAIIHARIERIVIATTDPRTGAAGSVFQLLKNPALNHQVEISQGVCQQEAADQLRAFFRARR